MQTQWLHSHYCFIHPQISGMLYSWLSLLLLIRPGSPGRSQFEEVSFSALAKFIEEEENAVVLFASPSCGEPCLKYEKLLNRIREDVVDQHQVWLVKVTDGQNAEVAKTYGNPEFRIPSLMFFRKKRPVLFSYEGAGYPEEGVLLDFFAQHATPGVVELNDETFEHDTQAASGATTGDWLVMFYHSKFCPTCLSRFMPRLENVAGQVKGRQNVAVVDRFESGAKTGRRFGISNDPQFILLHMGRVYPYAFKDYELKSLLHYAIKGYNLVPGVPVPQPKSAVDDYMAAGLQNFQENWLLYVVSITLFVLVVYKLNSPAIQEAKSSSSREKKKRAKKDD